VLRPDLDPDEQQHENAKDDQQRYDSGTAPRILSAAPLEREKQADDGGHKNCRPPRIQSSENFRKRRRFSAGDFWWRLEKDRHDDQRYNSYGTIYPKANAFVFS
jgi:hypothetical protein